MTTYEASVHIAAALGAALLKSTCDVAEHDQHRSMIKALPENLEACAVHAYVMAKKLAALAVADDEAKVTNG